MNRKELLRSINVAKGRGLEIGALTRPAVTKDMGSIEYVDRATTAELARWYENQPVNVADLVEVDHVWGARSLLECVGGERRYDYVVASHVLEHVPDLFGWLIEIASVLVDDGIASFSIPDKRFTFDHFRQTSKESELVDAYIRKLKKPDVRQIFDHFSQYRTVDHIANWEGVTADTSPPDHNVRGVFEACEKAEASGEYVDTHCWVFTPRSFVRAIDLGTRIFVLPYAIAALVPTSPGSNEFHVSLRRLPEAMSIEDRREAFLSSYRVLQLPSEDPDVAGNIERAIKAEREIEALLNSTSWRLTAPLRQAVSSWRRLIRRS